MTSIKTLLVANRGEIAVRVMRTARALGLRTVAVYSDADANAMHVREADTAINIGPPPVAESYLQIDRLIDAARRSGADAIHPGYGFLSENNAFSAACAAAGIIFVGPPAAAIEVMGDKARAKRAMLAAGVPCVPGYQGEDQSLATLRDEAERIGLPVMVKAAAGGGGRGMRLVDSADALESAIERARSEARNAFGSDELIIEKAILRPRHVEVQVFADQHGNIVYLGERDCSVQRRHQKVVEEAPCPVLTASLRAAMGEAAVEAARAVAYVGAGTVEFLLDESGSFYFLEMNTRLQVEHPVTELVTGFDLVEWQLRVARGERLPAEQADIELFGHAIEVRLYAEDPAAGFLPSTGPVLCFDVPEAPGVRLDTGVESGDAVSPYYDAMVAKLMAWGETREDARRRLIAALEATTLCGFANNRDFLVDVLAREDFAAGRATTAFIADNYGDAFTPAVPTSAQLAAAAAIQHTLAARSAESMALSVSPELRDWASADDLAFTHLFRGDAQATVVLTPRGNARFVAAVAGVDHQVELVSCSDRTALAVVDGERTRYGFYAEPPAGLWLAGPRRTLHLTDAARMPPESAEDATGGAVVAPMHGLLQSVVVSPGDTVVKGQRVAVLEAMKMQHELHAGIDGRVSEVIGAAGTQVAAGDLLLMIEAASD